MELRRLVALGLAVGEHRIEHHREHSDEDRDADPHDVGMEVEDLRGDRCDWRRQVHFPVRAGRGRQQRRHYSHSRSSCRRLQQPLPGAPQPHCHFDALHAVLENIDDPHTAVSAAGYRAASTRRKSLATITRSAAGSSSPNGTRFPANRSASRGRRSKPPCSTSTCVQ